MANASKRAFWAALALGPTLLVGAAAAQPDPRFWTPLPADDALAQVCLAGARERAEKDGEEVRTVRLWLLKPNAEANRADPAHPVASPENKLLIRLDVVAGGRPLTDEWHCIAERERIALFRLARRQQ